MVQVALGQAGETESAVLQVMLGLRLRLWDWAHWLQRYLGEHRILRCDRLLERLESDPVGTAGCFVEVMGANDAVQEPLALLLQFAHQ